MLLEPLGMYRELRELRNREGLRYGPLRDRIGEQLRFVFQIGDYDTHDAARAKAIAGIEAWICSYGQDEQTILRAALAMHPLVCHPTLERRLEWLTQQQFGSDSTVRRRLRKALKRLADDAVATGRILATSMSVGYSVEELRAEVVLTSNKITIVRERWRIKAVHSRLIMVCSQYGVLSLPADQPRDTMLDIQIDGGRLHCPERLFGPEGDVIAFGVELTDPIESGQTGEFGVQLRCPPGQPMASHYVANPRTAFAHFGLKVQFDPQNLPVRVWQVNRARHRLIDIYQPGDPLLSPAPSGQLEASFPYVGEDGAYGLAWSW